MGVGDPMTATVPPTQIPDETPLPTLQAPPELVEEYLRLVEARRGLDERLGYVRAELELVAASALKEEAPRARFLGARGAIGARLSPTCVFDRPRIARELQRMGKLSDVAVIQGPGLARYLAKEPIVAARLGGLVRMRRSVVLTASL